jgi:lipoprotein-anchoring transpeptidase ErfK/SrfK
MRTSFTVLFVIFLATSAEAEPRDNKTVTPWVIATSYKTDKFESCTMSRSAGELGITFVRARDGLAVQLDSPKWKLNQGKAYPVRLVAGSRSVDAQALAETKSVIIVLEDPRFNSKLRLANVLEVRGEGARLRVPLDGSSTAFERLETCFNQSEPTETNPVSTQISPNSETQSTDTVGAAVRINIDKTKQKMTVLLDGVEKYDWPVSSGRAGYSTPSGTYTAISMNEVWYSKEFDNSPMPHSIFFMKDGHAIHGSYEVQTLGKPVSHGCVRIAPENAATLFALVKENGLENTKVELTGVTPGGEYKVARQAGPRYGLGSYEPNNNYYAQPQWGRGFFGRSFGGPYYSRSQGYYYRQPQSY